MDEQHDRWGHLLHNLVIFGRLLRALGLDINPGRMIDLVEALEHITIGRQSDFYHAARSLLVHDRDDLALFDLAFEQFWRRPADDALSELPAFQQPPSSPEPLIAPPPLKAPAMPPPAAAELPEQPMVELTQTYSRRERLRRKDFGELSVDEIEAVKRFMQQLTWQLGQRQTRRQHSGRGQALDLRRGLRQNLRYGGEMLVWPRRRAKAKPRPLVVLADISGSMERYTHLLLHFIYGLAEGLEQPVESFVFGTRLTRVTRQLQGRDLDRALAEVAGKVSDWSGGTRIGTALKTFNFDWGRRVLGRGAIVLLISDGWDRGDPDLLAEEMARLQRSCHRLIWLNPLLGSDRYEPLTRGMQAALPYCDDFLPVHNLASLEELAAHLMRLTERRRR